jgi:hypothetical protein
VILSLFAVAASTYPLPWTPWYDNVNFACIQRKVVGGDGGVLSDDMGGQRLLAAGTLSHSCYMLQLTDPMYWDERDDDMYGWALQFGALSALASAVLGGISFFHLVHATCFPLEAVALEKIYKSYMVCALLSLFTMIALAVDPCKSFDGTGKCTRHRTHLAMGATGEIAACFFFLWAAWAVRNYSQMVRTNGLPQDANVPMAGSTAALMHKGNDRDDEEEEVATPTNEADA